MRILVIVLAMLSLVSACSSKKSTPAPPATPYVSIPLADLPANTQLVVYGNHTGWWRDRSNPVGVNSFNETGQKLQRFDTTATPGVYVAVFRNNVTNIDYGKATFTMPANGVTYNGTTNLGYKFGITRSNDNLVYTLTGTFSMANNPIASSNRYAYGGFAAGSYTPAGDVPTTGSATYTGSFIGFSSVSGLVTGNASIAVNFAANSSQVNGNITAITGGINDIALAATITNVAATLPSTFGAGGIATAGVSGGTGGALPTGTTGSIEGGFYGPNADEIGVTIRLTSGTNMLTGSVGGARGAITP